MFGSDRETVLMRQSVEEGFLTSQFSVPVSIVNLIYGADAFEEFFPDITAGEVTAIMGP